MTYRPGHMCALPKGKFLEFDWSEVSWHFWQLAVAKPKGKRWFSLNTHVGFLEDVYKRDLNTFWKNIL